MRSPPRLSIIMARGITMTSDGVAMTSYVGAIELYPVSGHDRWLISRNL
jgi:hypothetical protein